MKRCPQCNRVEADDALAFCRVDGFRLITNSSASESASTILLSPPQRSGESPTLVLESKPSIAVLAFANLSVDPQNEYFCDGLAEEILNSLARIDDLKVAARTSSFSFKGKDVSVDHIGQSLRVNKILEGSVQRAGNRIRITVQLINAVDGYHIWSERYDRELKDIFEVQDEITLAIVKALKLKLLGDEQVSLLKRGTDNHESFEAYLRGRFYWNKRTGAAVEKAVELFQQAVSLDQNFALAFVGLADSHAFLGVYAGRRTSETIPPARAAVERALQLEPNLAEAHASLGHIYYRTLEWEKCEQEYQRAISLNSNYATVHQWYSEYFRVHQRPTDEFREIKLAQELDPLSPMICSLVGEAHCNLGDLDAAFAEWQRVIELDPNFALTYFLQGGAYLQLGSYDEAVASFETAVALSGRGSITLGGLGSGYAMAGKTSEALAVLAELEERHASGSASAFSLAQVLVGLKDYERSIDWLEKDFEVGNTTLLVYGVHRNLYHELKTKPRYQELLRRMRMPL